VQPLELLEQHWFCTPDEASAESNARIPLTTENSDTKED
jgi:hypothetical protein